MFAAIISFTVCVGIPLTGAVYFLHRRDGTFFTFLTGVLCFYISQPLIRMPLLNLMGLKFEWMAFLPYTNIFLYFLFMGFTAGFFEESARYIGLKLFRKGRTSWADGIACGLGHGGCEAAWLFFTQVLPLALQGNAGFGVLLGAWERIFTMLIQIGLSLIVIYAIKKHKIQWLILAILLHTVIDFLIVLGNIWILEGLITLEGLVALLLIVKWKKNF
ncbi:MAG: YhfC family glutamic-type intramembrane protease [Eubacteriales bacterium]|nr:YhfC family glutamic-type intramembrane protease [Eubacteriales bacterium]